MSKEEKIIAMVFLSTIFFFLEMICGYYTGSIALLADSFHMLSDVASLLIALYATRLAKSKTKTKNYYSYGLQRAEVLGALINAISLLALSFTLIIQAFQKFFSPEKITQPLIVLYVASAGLLVNIIGITIFHDHSHHSHSHSHSHSHGTFEPIPSSEAEDCRIIEEAYEDEDERVGDKEMENPIFLSENVIRIAALIQERSDQEGPRSPRVQESQPHHHNNIHPDNHAHSHGDMNMHGVFLHILGDLLASVGVISSTAIILIFKSDWTIYMDPLTSLLITSIIIYSTIPLAQSATFILLQGTPTSISLDEIRRDILEIEGIVDVHELHVWQLSDTQTIASVHIVVFIPQNLDGLSKNTFEIADFKCNAGVEDGKGNERMGNAEFGVEDGKGNERMGNAGFSVEDGKGNERMGNAGFGVEDGKGNERMGNAGFGVDAGKGNEGMGNAELNERYMLLAALVKSRLHAYGIHSTTVQPEFVISHDDGGLEQSCLLRCALKTCETKVCCPP